MCCFIVLADDSKAADQLRGLLGRHRRLAAFDFNVSRDAVGAGDQLPRLVAGVPAPLDAGVRVGLLIGVGMLGISVELRDEAGSVEADGIGDRAVRVRGGAVVRVCTIRDGILIRMRLMVGRVRGALHTNLSVRFLEFRLLVAGDFGRGLLTLDRERHAAFLGIPLAAPPSQGEFFRVVASERVCAVRGNVAANIRVRSNGDLAGIAVGRVAFYLADREGVILKIIGFLRVIGRFCAALDRNQTGFLEVAFTGLAGLIGG